MRSRPLGSTGLVVSPLGLGLAALGRPGYINLGHATDLTGATAPHDLEARAHAVLDEALAAGIRYLDVARSYGRGEEFLASWLRARGVAPGDVTVGSKWGYEYTAGWRTDAAVHERKEHSAERFDRQVAESRAILGPHLALYQIHSATEESGVLERGEVLDRLARARDAGLAIGLTVTGPSQSRVVRRAMEIRRDGRPLFATVQATWNLLEPSAGSALAEARAAGLGVIVKEPLANGRLTDRNHEPALDTARTVLAAAAAKHGATIDALALAAALSLPFVDVVLSGAATVEHLRSNLRALELRIRRPERDALVAELAEPPQAYWDVRARLPWT